LQATASYREGVVGTATEELLSLPEAANRLGVSVYTVRRWIKDGKLRAFKPGKEYRVREADLEEFLRAREVRPKAPSRSPYEPSLLNGLEEERRIAIDYGACRSALEGFCDHWQPALSGERRLNPQAFQDFKADATSLSRPARELMGAEMTELGQQYDKEGDPVFYTEQSELGPAILRFHDLVIRMNRIGKEQFGEDLADEPEMGELIRLFPEAS
jgi:excisionase family DNA binding protein